jgi:hypothetical protein
LLRSPQPAPRDITAPNQIASNTTKAAVAVFTQLPRDYAPSKLWVNAVRLKAEVLCFDARTIAKLDKQVEAVVGKRQSSSVAV